MGIRFAARVIIGSISVGLSVAGTASAQNGSDISDLPKLYPAGYALWQQSLPYALGPLPDWLTSFNGTVTPLRDVSVGGASMKFGTVCKPHDCGGNIAGILYSSQRGRIVALVRLRTKGSGTSLMTIGPISNAEFSCVQRLIDDDQSTLC